MNLPQPWLPFAEGNYATPSGKCEFYSARMAQDGYDPLPTWTPPRWTQSSATGVEAATLPSRPMGPLHRGNNMNVPTGRGLLPRRSFLGSGLALSAASLGPAVYAAPLAARMPDSMKTLGGADQAYGQPAAHEQAVLRVAHPTAPQTAGFSIWRTPLQQQRGIITPSGLHFSVHHNGLPDNGSTCPDWKLAHEELRLWSDANPGHVPITVLVEIKRDDPARKPLYADMDEEKFRQLDQTVADIVGAEKAVTPADLMGRWPTLGAMAQNGGWPSLAQLKGKIIFLLHPDSVYTRLYIGMDPSLKTQWFVPAFGAGETAVYPDDAAFLIANNPDIGLVRPLVARGCIVRVFMDYDRVYNASMKEAALASGAQILTTDLEKGVVLPRSDYVAEFPGGYTVARNLPAQ